MAWIINCDCGTTVKGKTDEEIVDKAKEHAKIAHAMTITREQVLAIREPAEQD